MVLSYILLVTVAIGGYIAFLSYYNRESETLIGTVFRAVVVVAVLLVSLPLGVFLGSSIVSAFTESLLAGSLVFTGSLALLTVLGFGLYLVAEGEFPTSLRRHVSAE
ncbi:hypothetical protein [Halostagnicola sp. A-GB9-2]|uniref:hypothetical protein n=1 Tax=Halostagnicola sp. A-GB9-2 TaxID=3048066 RepID=UPI0024C0372F|nr:hypothetical protein [Halostagnicola sp. A-GB9-2]MDJ1432534.1 hypothetical protein [Halostagnicola sp. A-GB9-2]